tara:strand:+ start:629 stop:850 length:222 start_codon:yes stop_codon:yes gene_type:complete
MTQKLVVTSQGQNLVDLTEEEETALAAKKIRGAEEAEAGQIAETARLENQASAKAKLEALGLTADEVRDTFGL